MKARVCIVPKGGGEISWVFDIDTIALPQKEDVIKLLNMNSETPTIEGFVVRRLWWSFIIDKGSDGPKSQPEIGIEVEPSNEHDRSMY